MEDQTPVGCRTCNCDFVDREEQTQHYKLDFHRYNIKQQLLGRSIVSEEEFALQCDDLSSLSGSDSDSTESELDEIVVSQFIETSEEVNSAVFSGPRMFFKHDGDYYKCFSSLFVNSKENISDQLLTERFQNIKSKGYYHGQVGVLMFGAQHFAGAVFNGNREIICHKTFHRYTVRAKQGTIQSERDGKGGSAPKSLGSSLRRANQAALYRDVQDLVKSWHSHLSLCDVILFRVAAHNKHTFNVLRDTSLKGSEHKLRTIPFTTYRATLKEVKRVFSVVVRMEESCGKEFDDIVALKNIGTTSSEEDTVEKSQPSHTRSIPNSHLKTRTPEHRTRVVERDEGEEREGEEGASRAWYEEEDSVMYHLIQCVVECDVERMSDILTQPEALQAINSPLDHSSTLLHKAVTTSQPEITKLLLYSGASPVLKDHAGKVPYELASEKDQRDEMRRYMAHAPIQWDYKAAKIPSPLTREMEDGQNKKRQEKKRVQAKARVARDKLRKEAETEKSRLAEEKLIAETHKLRMKQLTPRERSLLAAEARLAAAQGTRGSTSGECTNCHTGLDGLVPFEKSENKFCSVNCVKEHRTK